MAPERVRFLGMLKPPFRDLAYNVRMLLQGNFERYREFVTRLDRARNKSSAVLLMLGEYGYGVPPQYTLDAWHALPPDSQSALTQLLQHELDDNQEFLSAETQPR